MTEQPFTMPEFPNTDPQFPQIPDIPPMQEIPAFPQDQPVPEIPRIPDDVQDPPPAAPPERPERTVTVCPVPHTMDDFSPDTLRILSLPRISQFEAESCRHKKEKPWYRRLIFLNIFLIIMTVTLVISGYDEYQKQMTDFTAEVIADYLAQSAESEDTDAEDSEDEDPADDTQKDDEKEEPDYEEFAEKIPLGYKMLGYGIALMLIGYLSLYYLNAQVRAKSVKVTERNFPEVHALIHSFSDRLGMKAPEAYIVSENGILNAFSAFLFKRQYIQINSEVFEVAYREHRDMNALAFIIAHEVSHIYFGHATLHYNAWIWFSQQLPLVSQIASRTREYSCDRLAQRLTNYDGIGSMLMLVMDRHLYYMVDVQDYLDHAAQEGGFFLWLVNLFSTHPVMTKRIRALADWNGSGELY